MTDLPTQQKPLQKTPPATVSAEKIHVTVRNRLQIIYDDDIQSLSSRNETGVFDILPEHANFISLLISPLILRELNGQTKEIPFLSGIIKVKDNAIHCYIDLISKKTPVTPPPAA